MSNLSRLIVAYIVAIPLALALGFLVATPNSASMAALGFVLFCLAVPLLLQWHHDLLIVAWNSVFMVGFLPGQPRLWLVLAVLSFGIAALNHVLRLKSLLRAPGLEKPVLFLLGVVLLTAWMRDGLGSRAFGGASYGGRNYYYVLGAFMGYFALISQTIPLLKRELAARWFFLAGTTSAISNLLYLLGPAAYFLYWIIPPNGLGFQFNANGSESTVQRIAGLGPAGPFFLCFLLARWGVRGLFEWNKPWRFLLAILAVVASMFSGFRSQVLDVMALFAIQFMMEGLWKTVLLPVTVLLGLLFLAPAVLFANKLPSAVQRSLAFLPVDINPDIRADADGSIDWRVGMWRDVWVEVPKYLLVGKGYAIDPNELYVTATSGQNGYEGSMLAGDYHSGPLSILVPFGVFGTVAFVWLLGAGAKILYGNYRYGDARLRRVNMTLLSYFLTEALFFVFVFGAFSTQLFVFLGVLGLSISLNGGVCRRPALARQTVLSHSLATSWAAT